MFKKIIFIFILFMLVGSIIVNGSGCTYNEGAGLGEFLNDCKPDKVVDGGDMTIEDGFKDKLNVWVTNIALVLGVLAVGSLVYAGILFQLSAGEDEKITKAKNLVKWTLIGFLLLISASGIIYLVINVIFGLGES